MKCEIITGNLPQLWQGLLKELQEQKYPSESIRHYRECIGRIDYFMRVHKITMYSEDVGVNFITAWEQKSLSKRPCYMRFYVRRLDDVLNGREYSLIQKTSNRQALYSFESIYTSFRTYLQKQELREGTQKLQSFYCHSFLLYLESCGIKTIEGITTQVIYDAFLISKAKDHFCTSVRKFMKFLYQQGLHPIDLSEFVPCVRRPKPLPTTYTNKEILSMLSGVDLSTSKGLRDMAILLLASKLGIRVSDICNLDLNNIHRDRNTVEFVQVKTGVPMKLELLPEVRYAVDAYITNGRPQTESTKLFIRAQCPFSPLGKTGVAHIVHHYLKKANIETAGKKTGPHSLRMSLATELVSDDVPYTVVRKILGHQNSLSFNNYVKLDIEKLRRCALDVPPASGKLKEWLYSSNRGVK